MRPLPPPMRIVNLNPDTDIGASAWLVEMDGNRLLMDAGAHPKREGRASLPLYSAIADEDVDAIALTHCHHDHVGSLPVALRQFPKAHILMTELSYFLLGRVLHNSVNVMIRQRDESGVRDYPLYTHDELEELEPHFQGFRYSRHIEWNSHAKARAGLPSPTLEFHDAGHALGSAGILVRGKSQSLFYTGDVCFHDQTLLKAACFSGHPGRRSHHGNHPGRPRHSARFHPRRPKPSVSPRPCTGFWPPAAASLIPTFAFGRTQEILAQLALMMAAGQLRRQPIYIGGLGRVFTETYDLKAHLPIAATPISNCRKPCNSLSWNASNS